MLSSASQQLQHLALSEAFNTSAFDTFKNTFKNIINTTEKMMVDLDNVFHISSYDDNTNTLTYSSDTLTALLNYYLSKAYHSLLSSLLSDNEDLKEAFDDMLFNHEKFDSIVFIFESMRKDWVGSYHLAQLLKFIYNVVKRVNNRSSNSFKRSKGLFWFIFAIHEIFENLLNGFYEYFNHFLPNGIGFFEVDLLDYESRPYHKTKQAIKPHNMNQNEFITGFIQGLSVYYCHDIQDVQSFEFINRFDEVFDSVLCSVLADISFYIRILPGINIEAVKTDILNPVYINKTRNNIMKKYE